MEVASQLSVGIAVDIASPPVHLIGATFHEPPCSAAAVSGTQCTNVTTDVTDMRLLRPQRVLCTYKSHSGPFMCPDDASVVVKPRSVTTAGAIHGLIAGICSSLRRGRADILGTSVRTVTVTM